MPFVPNVPHVVVTDSLGQTWELTQREYSRLSSVTRRLTSAYSILNPTPEQMGPPA